MTRVPTSCSLAMRVGALWLTLALIMSHGDKSRGLALGDLLPMGKSSPDPSPPSTPSGLPMGKSSPSPSPPTAPSALQVGFYKGKCPNTVVDVEAHIADKCAEEFRNNPSILPALLRMQFHDCFVNGCDASILIVGPTTEKTASPNQSVRGYDFIDTVKASLELECPGIVSCADIIAIATKVLIKLGGGPDYSVETGRMDGLRSEKNDVNLPSPSMTVPQSISAFGAQGFSVEQMVVLLGGHTVGITHCSFFQDRLYNGTSQFDPDMDSDVRKKLMLRCPNGTNTNNVVDLDQNPESSNIVDDSFYGQLKRNKGIFFLDQALARDPQTSDIVSQLASDGNLFKTKFAAAMIELQRLPGKFPGEIRKVCSKFN